LNTLLETLEHLVLVKGYNGQTSKLITLILQTHLQVNGQQQYNVLFLITNLGHYDVILRQKWLSYLDLWLDVRNRQLIWLATMLPIPSFVKEITVTMQNLLGTVTDLAY